MQSYIQKKSTKNLASLPAFQIVNRKHKRILTPKQLRGVKIVKHFQTKNSYIL